MAARKDFLLSDPQVIYCPPIFAKKLKAKLIVECATCHRRIEISANNYWRLRQHGPWSCYGCRKPTIDAVAGQNPLYRDPKYRQQFADLHKNQAYHERVHNAEVNSRIAASSREAWQNEAKRQNHLRHRQSEEGRAAVGARVKAASEERYRHSQQQRSDNFIAKAVMAHDGKYDYSAAVYQRAHTAITINCRDCGHAFEQLPMVHLRGSGCPRCNISAGQREICRFLDGRCTYSINNREELAPLEIDLYLPHYKLGIEYHGLFWHSYNRPETKDEKYRHQHKRNVAQAAGITLLQFCDHEWRERRAIVTSMIEHKLGLSKPLNARALNIVQLDNNQAAAFFTANHLAGHRSARSCFGLSDGKGVVMALSCNPLPGKPDELEIIRMASLTRHNVRGGASRLLRHTIRTLQPRRMHTFADLRHSSGAGYKMLGFTVTHITGPGYFYHFNGGSIKSRLQCQKHKLVNMLANFDRSRSESANMFTNGYRRFWDAGHMKLVLDC